MIDTVVSLVVLVIFLGALIWRVILVRPRRDWIQTYTGRAFRPMGFKPDEVDIRDIARGLSMLCRYGGQVQRFYSVAEHCVRVARRVWELTKDIEITRKAAVHDAQEGLGFMDIPSPIKCGWRFWFYRRAEHRAARTIAFALGVMVRDPPEVKAADVELRGTEARQLKSPIHPEWRLPPVIPGFHDLGWEPCKAEIVFLRTWDALNGPVHEIGARMVALAREFP